MSKTKEPKQRKVLKEPKEPKNEHERAFKEKAKAEKRARKEAKREKKRLEEEQEAAKELVEVAEELKKSKKSKKRKLEDDETDEERKKSKKSKKSKKTTPDDNVMDEPMAEGPEDTEEPKKSKKSKKRKLEEPAEETVAAETSNGVPAAEKDVVPKDPTKKEIKELKRKARRDGKALQNEPDPPASTDVATNGEEAEGAEPDPKAPANKHQRFIVFIGNLPFSATKESIAKHFSKISPTAIRLMSHKETGKPKGFAFMDFDNYDRMKTCLKMYHHTSFDDGVSPARKINVELTAGGGGTSDARKTKLATKNTRLDEQRGRRAIEEQKKREKHESRELRKQLRKASSKSAHKTNGENEGITNGESAEKGTGKKANKSISIGTGNPPGLDGAIDTPAKESALKVDKSDIHPSRLSRLQF